jgi:hypothetical protein
MTMKTLVTALLIGNAMTAVAAHARHSTGLRAA